MSNRVKLKDIAEVTGFSVTAVSRALQDKPDIGEEAKQCILNKAKEMGYKPNSIARSLRLGRTNVLGVIIPDNSNPYFAILLKGIEETARKYGYTVIISNTSETAIIEKKMVDSLLGLHVDGILAFPIAFENYKGADLPLIFISRFPTEKFDSENLMCGAEKYHYLINNDFKGAYMGVSHLIETGKKDIFFMVSDFSLDKLKGFTQARINGYKKALEDYNIEYCEDKIILGISTIDDSYEAAGRLIEQHKEAMGIFCINDYVAIGVLRAIYDRNIQIPQQAGVVGYDDIEVASFLRHKLTTVKQDRYHIGSEATRQLINIIEKSEKEEMYQDIIEPKLIIRETT